MDNNTKHKSTMADVEAFMRLKNIAVVGVSREYSKFGNTVARELKQKNYRVFPVNPNLKTFENEPCYPNLKAIPEKIDGVVISVNKTKTEDAVREAISAGVTHIWIQQMSQSDAAIRLCRENNIKFVANECILMFAQPVNSFHKFHQFIWKLIGKLPK